MRLGALLTPTDGTNPEQLANQARQLEEAGFSSIWSAQAMGRGFMMIDPLIALACAATVTSKVELGTAIMQLPLYNPTDIALKAYSLKMLSGDRFLFGVGAGSTAADYQIHRTDFKSRFSAFEQCLEHLRSTLADGSANGGNLTPPAAATGGPPILFGTWGKNVARAAIEFDGWIASGMHRTPVECATALQGYRAAGGKRAIVSTIRVFPDTDLEELRDTLLTYEQAGFDDAVVMIMPGGPPPQTIRALLA